LKGLKMNEEPSGDTPRAREPSDSGRPPPPEPAEGREREPSLMEKIDNLWEFLEEMTPGKIQERMETMKAEREWRGAWHAFWVTCALPLLKEEVDILKNLLDREGNVALSQGFRRCGKTTSFLMMEAFCRIFSTQEKPLPKTVYLDGQALGGMLADSCEKVSEPKPEELEEFILGEMSFELDLEGETAREGLQEIEVILVDELLSAIPEAGKFDLPDEETVILRQGEIGLELLKAVRRLCPRALILTTNGHSLEAGSWAEEVLVALYETNQKERQSLRIFERGLPDAWSIDTAFANFIGQELEGSRGVFNPEEESLEVIIPWLLNRVFLFSLALGNPYIIDQFLKANHNKQRKQRAVSDPAGFEKMMDEVIREPSANRSVYNPFRLSYSQAKEIAASYPFIDAGGLVEMVSRFNENMEEFYHWGILSVYTVEARELKYQQASFTDAQAMVGLIARVFGEMQRVPHEELSAKRMLAICREELLEDVDYVLRAQAVSKEYDEALI
jgi:hypothetical protein